MEPHLQHLSQTQVKAVPCTQNVYLKSNDFIIPCWYHSIHVGVPIELANVPHRRYFSEVKNVWQGIDGTSLKLGFDLTQKTPPPNMDSTSLKFVVEPDLCKMKAVSYLKNDHLKSISFCHPSRWHYSVQGRVPIASEMITSAMASGDKTSQTCLTYFLDNINEVWMVPQDSTEPVCCNSKVDSSFSIEAALRSYQNEREIPWTPP